tara:strand:+ start:164 stop:427 length:264 start_codon:yes stop_codon:yes gene_type:complete
MKSQEKSHRRYKLLVYDTPQAVLQNLVQIKKTASQCDQLNIVIRQEGDMDNPKILSIAPQIKLFCGEAWALIHERRFEDGWYDSLQF